MVSIINKQKPRYSATLLLLVLLIAPLLSIPGMVQSASAATVVTQKWSRSGFPANWEGGMVIGDLDNDGYEEVIYAGKGGIYVLNGATGATKYSYLDSRISSYCQPQLYDIEGDGR